MRIVVEKRMGHGSHQIFPVCIAYVEGLGQPNDPSSTRKIPLRSVWLPDARNNRGDRGAFADRPRLSDIDQAVAELKAAYGDMPVCNVVPYYAPEA